MDTVHDVPVSIQALQRERDELLETLIDEVIRYFDLEPRLVELETESCLIRVPPSVASVLVKHGRAIKKRGRYLYRERSGA
jgi:hypothetical protein